ncbi:hypothetical protein EJB05_03968, partial [Eragrostis curvula]
MQPKLFGWASAVLPTASFVLKHHSGLFRISMAEEDIVGEGRRASFYNEEAHGMSLLHCSTAMEHGCGGVALSPNLHVRHHWSPPKRMNSNSGGIGGADPSRRRPLAVEEGEMDRVEVQMKSSCPGQPNKAPSDTANGGSD